MRQATIDSTVTRILEINCKDRFVIAVDGVDGSGKSYFAKELFEALKEKTNHQLFLASVDGFHHPQEIRYKKGKGSPIGFYEDSYNYLILRSTLLEPFLSKQPEITLRAFDYRADIEVCEKAKVLKSEAILVFEGIFLHRSELVNYWDFSVFLEAKFETTYHRMSIRDGSASTPEDPSNQRYYEGQKHYLRECLPDRTANLLIDNSDFESAYIKEERF